MMLEAVTKGLVAPGNIAKKLKSRREIVAELTTYAEQVQKIPEMNINIVPLTQDLCFQAVIWQQKYGLMNQRFYPSGCLSGAELPASCHQRFGICQGGEIDPVATHGCMKI